MDQVLEDGINIDGYLMFGLDMVGWRAPSNPDDCESMRGEMRKNVYIEGYSFTLQHKPWFNEA